MQPDEFTDKRADGLIHRYADVITRIQAQWPGGSVVLPDPHELVLWLLPAEPLESENITYGDVVERLRSSPHWAAIGPSNDTIHRVTRPYITGHVIFHVDTDGTWVVHHP